MKWSDFNSFYELKFFVKASHPRFRYGNTDGRKLPSLNKN